ncbi:MAG: ThuA domain-containing protein, partial [Acidobacteria bacterium]|nr:ThuA domain-containing protein [Acidobacteriota bacterium]
HEQRNHNSHTLFPLLAAPLARMGIQMTHANTPAEALVADRLHYYDGIVIYGNHMQITPEQEQALVSFVEGGKGLIAIHSASYMFIKSERYIPMVGGQFLRHGTGEFAAEIVQPNHPVMQGLQPFTTWDETYVHTRHNPTDRTVLMERVDGEGREPYTWVRNQGKGRVFYTAFGHDNRTWSNAGFQRLVANGIAWAVSEDARAQYAKLRMPGVQYVEGFNVPNYERRDPAPQYQIGFSADDAEKFIALPAEFELTRFASDPDIFKPISFNFDERGRMWVIETKDYPNVMLGGAPGSDRIRILEDTNNDGKADKFTLFADGLNVPTSLVFSRGGVIVSGAPNFLYLKDTNGDDKADVREVLSTGWGINDTHAIASNLMYGHDNYVWGVVGYSGFNGTMNGRQMQFGQGMYRFKPDGSGFDYIAGATNNTWGLGLSETFDVFGGTANNDQSFHVAIPNRYFQGIDGIPNGTAGGRGVGPGYSSMAQYYAVHPLTPYIRQVDVFGGFTAGSGHQLYTARQFPKSYWNRKALISEPTAHLLALGEIERQGSGYVSRDGWNLIASAEEWFAPVHAMVGPDGAVWFADWYNFIIQHNPTPQGFSNGRGNAYETSMRDKERGRLYRIAYKGAKPSPQRSLSVNNPAGLVAALADDNMFWRLHGQRLLVERGQADVVPQLLALVRNTSVDELGLNGGALHALWTLHGLGQLTAPTGEVYQAAVAALKHPAAGVRKAAAMVLPPHAESARAIIDAGMLADADLNTRLAVVLALADMPQSPEIGAALFKAGQAQDNYNDKWLGRAIYVAAMKHGDAFLEAARREGPIASPATLPLALRLPSGNNAPRPDWRTPSAADVKADWKPMTVPGQWETRGLPDFDGAVWFTRSFTVTDTSAAKLTLGPMRNSGEAWLNGQQLFSPQPPGRGGPGGGRGAGPAGGRAGFAGRGNAQGEFEIPAGTLRAGENVLTVRIQNNRNEGGFLAPTGDGMFMQVGSARVPLDGAWQYRVERQTNAGPMYAGPADLAAHVAFTKAGGVASASAAITGPLLPTGAPAAPVAPMSPAETARFEAGRQVYSTICIACHQADGRGADKVAPTLVGSALATGNAPNPIRILLHGKQGTVGLMPPLGTGLSDEQIANVLTYVRREWGNTAGAVMADQVAQERKATAGRNRPYTPEELQ